ncbi:hypothetical protein AB4Z40_32940 [Bosea sp. 2YAB26]|jgi:hypothetical protein|uniref:hypothetical protein n=1 Tax=Bosea sp. 2YAB26 TaxID=3237478 RepID=UPI003F8EA543
MTPVQEALLLELARSTAQTQLVLAMLIRTTCESYMNPVAYQMNAELLQREEWLRDTITRVTREER